ncbi:MAG: hypothetical protein HYY35_11110 [Deltaproteobacteria bacterium]|nr:hypothetical protein [Deltaproteobacteria bacterium]
MKAAHKVTVQLPDELLDKARAATGAGITQTIRRGLELVAAGRAYDDLRKLRGRVPLSLDLRRIRDDRS